MANTLNGRLTPTNNMRGALTNEGRLTGQLGGVGAAVTYASLPDKPSINGVTLVGNKTTGDLNINYNDLKNLPSIPDVGEIDERLDNLEGNMTSLGGRVTTAEENITSLGGRVTTAEGNITSLDGRVTTNEGDISGLQGDTSALDTRLTTAEGNITSLGGRVTTAEGNITSLDTRLTTAEGNITSLDGRVTTNEGDISDLQGGMSQAQSDISQLNSSKAKYKDVGFTLSSTAWRGIYYADITIPVSINKIISIYVKSIAMNLPCSCYMATTQANSIRVWVPSTAGSDIASQTGTLRIIYCDNDISN